jgi:hypothetical protein
MAKAISPDAVTKVLNEGPRSNKELRESLGLSIEKYDPRLDRKLQQLRKEGKIHLVGGRWALNTVKACPTCKGRGWVFNKSEKADKPAD